MRKAGIAVDNERDLVLFVDENESEYTMEIMDYFEYDGEEFAMLFEVDDEHNKHDEECLECGCECYERDVYIMQVILDEDAGEELFIPVEDDKLDEIVDALEQFYEEYNGSDEEFTYDEDK